MKKREINIIVSDKVKLSVDEYNVQPIFYRMNKHGVSKWYPVERYFSTVARALEYIASSHILDTKSNLTLRQWQDEYLKKLHRLAKETDKQIKLLQGD